MELAQSGCHRYTILQSYKIQHVFFSKLRCHGSLLAQSFNFLAIYWRSRSIPLVRSCLVSWGSSATWGVWEACRENDSLEKEIRLLESMIFGVHVKLICSSLIFGDVFQHGWSSVAIFFEAWPWIGCVLSGFLEWLALVSLKSVHDFKLGSVLTLTCPSKHRLHILAYL